MATLTRKRRASVTKFMELTGSNYDVALQALMDHEWHLHPALDHFNSREKIRALDGPRQLEQLFQRFKEPHVDMILANGIECFCRELQVDPQDIVMLVLSWHMRAATMCEFSRQEFISGLEALRVDSIETLRDKIPLLRAELKDEQTFSAVYTFAFDWAKEKGQRCMALDTAIGMWQLLLAEKRWPFVDRWCLFLQTRHGKAISRDTWTLLLEFVKTGDPAAPDYDADGAWPSLIDGFVGYLREGGIVPSS